MITLGVDPAWGGLGWCLATARGPVSAGHVVLSGRTWRWSATRAFLAELDHTVGDQPCRLVIERAPAVYRGAERGAGKAGNQASVGLGLGQISGAMLLWGCRAGWAYPWEVETTEWRGWWNLRGCRDRAAYKAAAVWTARAAGWHRVDGVRAAWDALEGRDGQADLAEAMCIAVGGAANAASAPKGPKGP